MATRKHQQATIQFYPGQLEEIKEIVSTFGEPSISEVVRKAVTMYLTHRKSRVQGNVNEVIGKS